MPAFRPRGASRPHDPLSDLIFVRGSGSYVWDTDGHRYLDLIGGYSTCLLGHSHPRLVRVAQEQLSIQSFAHGGQSLERAALEEALAGKLPSPSSKNTSREDASKQNKVWLCTAGARGIEVAWKIAAAHRPGGVAHFDLAYHGRSLATARISDTARSRAFEDAGVLCWKLPFPRSDAPRSPEDSSDRSDCDRALERAEAILRTHASQIAMLIMEPAIGSRGYYFAPPYFCRALADLARGLGIVVVSDEIQMGLGRLGAMSVAHADGWQPDLVVLGKGLAGGIMPIAAVVGASDLIDRLEPGIESETFAGTPLACRIASEVLTVLDEEGWIAHAEERGEEFRAQLRAGLPACVRIEGRGMASVLFLSDAREVQADQVRRWVLALCESEVLVHLSGAERNRLALLPPLNIDRSALADAATAIIRCWYASSDTHSTT